MNIRKGARLAPRGAGSPEQARRRYFYHAALEGIEALEPRTLFSVVVVPGGKSATYTDLDGDLVTIAISKGAFSPGNFVSQTVGLTDQLQTIDLSAGGFDGANLTVTVHEAGGGDGQANIGYINSTGHDLGAVTIQGDLGRIDAGDANTATAGVKSLTVLSMGAAGLTTQGGAGDLVSNINGSLGTLKITGSLLDASINVTGTGSANIGAVTIGGSMVGNATDQSGSVIAAGSIGTVKVTGSLQGGGGVSSAALVATAGTLGNVTIGGSVTGGSGDHSAQIFSLQNMGKVTIGGTVAGGDGNESAEIGPSNGKLAGVAVSQELLGGQGDLSGRIISGSDLGPVSIGQDVTGGGGANSGSISSSTGKITSVSMGGDLRGGSGAFSGAIDAQLSLGAVKIGVEVRGGTGQASGSITSNTGNITSVTIAGGLQGGDGQNSAEIYAQVNLGAVKCGESIFGGVGALSGAIVAQTGNVAGVTIGGSLSGGNGSQSGYIFSGANMGPIKTTGSLIGQSGLQSGLISVTGTLASVSIGGAILGGAGAFSGGINVGTTTGTVTVGSKLGPSALQGGDGMQSGTIFSTGSIKQVTVFGSVSGGTGADAGLVSSNTGAIAKVTITGSLIGGPALGAGGVFGMGLGTVLIGADDNGGFISSGSAITSITVDGNVTTLGAASSSAFIGAATVLGSVTIKGDLTGLENGTASSPVVISAGGTGKPGKTDLAIKSISITGNVNFANILAGYDLSTSPVDRHAQIGAITVAGNWAAGNIVAGAENAASGNADFGDGNDARIPASSTADTATPLSSIASIKIGGTVAGTDSGANAVDHFGFVAQQVAALTIDGAKITLATGASNDNMSLGATGDFTLDEIM